MAATRASGKLAQRLGRIRELAKISGNGTSVSAGISDIPSETIAYKKVNIPGWFETSPLVFERETYMKLPIFRSVFSPYLPLLFPRERAELGLLNAGTSLSSSLVFFDLETTGLSHGAGTVAFMAGIARFDGDGLCVRQLLLADYPGELSFLSRFAELVGSNPVFVSFNGKCFDSQILSTRFSMNGMRPEFITRSVLHLDLLFPSRRIWKKEIGSCRLSAIEMAILGIERICDLPGSEAPDAWFDFVRSGILDRLLAIGDHNRDDCFALALLLFTLDSTIEEGKGRASLIRALDLRNARRYAEAALFLRPLANDGDPLALKILAIDAEHRLHDFEDALQCAEKLNDALRIQRIRGKIEKKSL